MGRIRLFQSVTKQAPGRHADGRGTSSRRACMACTLAVSVRAPPAHSVHRSFKVLGSTVMQHCLKGHRAQRGPHSTVCGGLTVRPRAERQCPARALGPAQGAPAVTGNPRKKTL